VADEIEQTIEPHEATAIVSEDGDGPYEFKPGWCLAPSETLREWLHENGMGPSVLAASCADPCGHEIPHTSPSTRSCREGRKQAALTLIDDVLARRPLTEQCALALARGTGVPARFWLALEHNYRAGLAAGLKDVTPEDDPRA